MSSQSFLPGEEAMTGVTGDVRDIVSKMNGSNMKSGFCLGASGHDFHMRKFLTHPISGSRILRKIAIFGG